MMDAPMDCGKSNHLDLMASYLAIIMFGHDPTKDPGTKMIKYPSPSPHSIKFTPEFITPDKAANILRRFWNSSNGAEVIKIFKILEGTGLMTRVENECKWRINRPTPIAPYKPPLTPPPAYGSRAHIRNLGKGGSCPRCGYSVPNKNRHNNKDHTREECRLFTIRRILDE